MGRQWRRALALLRGAGLVEADVRGRYLAARCLMEVGVHRQISRVLVIIFVVNSCYNAVGRLKRVEGRSCSLDMLQIRQAYLDIGRWEDSAQSSTARSCNRMCTNQQRSACVVGHLERVQGYFCGLAML